MKHVVILGTTHPYRGGLATFNERLARQFQAQGYKVTIYTFSLQYPSFLFPGKSQYSTSPAPTDLNINAKVNSINPLNWLSVGNEIKNLKPDFVVVRYWLPFMGPCLGTILRRVKKNRFTRVVCIADNVVPHEKRFGDRVFTKYFIKPVDAFITMSNKVAKDLEAFNTAGKKVTTIDHPLYDNFGEKVERKQSLEFLKLPDEGKFVFLFFGFIRKYKGLDLLLEAANLLKEKTSQFTIIIAGEFYEDEKPYLAQYTNLKLENEVVWHNDFIKDEEVKYYFSAANAVVQPYRNATQSGVTPLAYHFNVPMVVTNVGNLPVMVPDSIGIVVEPTAQAIANGLYEMMQANIALLAQNIEVEKKKFSWETFVDVVVAE
jgi:glycosyltransferase involved in cell wall biosynthesis